MSEDAHAYWRENIDLDHDLHKVMIKRDALIDGDREDRKVKIKVYYPQFKNVPDAKNAQDSESGKDGVSNLLGSNAPARLRLPVIVWSHGLGGGADGAAFLSRFIASQGYVIVHLQHHGTDTSLWEGKAGHPWDVIRQTKITRETTLNRFLDVPFLLDSLPEWMAQHPEIGEIADLSNIGMSGHSFGALTTQVMAGMMFPDINGKLRRARETRFKAGILYSPGPINHLSLDPPEDIYGFIDMPLLHMTGTDDSSPVEDWDYKKRLVVHEHTTKADKHLLVIKDGDHMVFNGSRGKLGKNPNRDRHEAIIKITALAYWDMMLKGDSAAQEWLTAGGIDGWLGADGEYKSS